MWTLGIMETICLDCGCTPVCDGAGLKSMTNSEHKFLPEWCLLVLELMPSSVGSLLTTWDMPRPLYCETVDPSPDLVPVALAQPILFGPLS
jgi:hypothetical protein